MNKEHEHDTHLNAFWDPMQLAAISTEETRKVRLWAGIIFALAIIVLIAVVVFLIVPTGEHFKLRRGSSVIVDGKTKASRKIVHTDGVREELAVTNIQVGEKEKLANKSPLLQSKKGIVIPPLR